MHGEFLLQTGALLGALALLGLTFRRLRQSVIPAFILLGIAVRPLVHDEHLVATMGTVGVVLLLFFMGLEFSVGALLANRRRILRNGGIDLLLNLPAGLLAGWALGWGLPATMLLAGAFYISSSAIIAKSVIEMQRAAYPETESVLGVLVFEDLFIALFLAVLSGAVLVAEPDAMAAAMGMGRALLFFGLVVLVSVTGKKVLDRVFDIESDDLFVLVVGSVVLLLSWGAILAGLSEAIGAFLAGLLLAETRHKGRAEHLLSPVQGLFAALFFFAFGLSIDPGAFGDVWMHALALALLGIALKVAGGWWIGQREGLGSRTSLSLGLTLVPRGEFSIIFAGIAVTIGFERLGAMIALFVLILSIVGTTGMQLAPWLGRRMFPRRDKRSLAEKGFSPELAGFGD